MDILDRIDLALWGRELMPADEEDLPARMLAGVSGALSDTGLMATRAVVIVEVVEADGSMAVWTAVDPGAKAWETLGLLSFALERERAGFVRRELQGDD